MSAEKKLPCLQLGLTGKVWVPQKERATLKYYQGHTLGPICVSNCEIPHSQICRVLIIVPFTSDHDYKNLFS